MKIFSFIGIAATVWVGYVIVKNQGLQSGWADLQNRLFGTPTVTSPAPTASLSLNIAPTSPSVSTPIVTTSTTNQSIGNNIINNLDWGVNKISTAPDYFTSQGKAANLNSQW